MRATQPVVRYAIGIMLRELRDKKYDGGARASRSPQHGQKASAENPESPGATIGAANRGDVP